MLIFEDENLWILWVETIEAVNIVSYNNDREYNIIIGKEGEY